MQVCSYSPLFRMRHVMGKQLTPPSIHILTSNHQQEINHYSDTTAKEVFDSRVSLRSSYCAKRFSVGVAPRWSLPHEHVNLCTSC